MKRPVAGEEARVGPREMPGRNLSVGRARREVF